MRRRDRQQRPAMRQQFDGVLAEVLAHGVRVGVVEGQRGGGFRNRLERRRRAEHRLDLDVQQPLQRHGAGVAARPVHRAAPIAALVAQAAELGDD